MQYAENTSVPVEKSRAEIEKVVTRYGASSFCSGWEQGRAIIGFEMKNRQLRFILPLPSKTDGRFTTRMVRNYRKAATPEQALSAWEQACRQSWRALLLVIKAKMEAVESKISSFDSEFMANLVLPTGQTIGEMILPKIENILTTGDMPRLLPAPPEAN